MYPVQFWDPIPRRVSDTQQAFYKTFDCWMYVDRELVSHTVDLYIATTTHIVELNSQVVKYIKGRR